MTTEPRSKHPLREFDRHDLSRVGAELHAFAAELYPICRSITGDGIRETLERIAARIPVEITRVPSGTRVFDWEVPREWQIRDASIRDRRGERVVDLRRHSLHVVSYSSPVCRRMTRSELEPHLHSLPEHPDWIPYRTTYYREDWGFCLTHRQRLALGEGEYEVEVDSTLEPGHLVYGECCLPGESSAEVLISVHACHPSLANDNLSGIAVATWLAGFLRGLGLRYTYRLLFLPGTIGAIAWLAANRAGAGRIRHGMVLTCVGDGGGFHYKRSRRGDAEIDRAAAHALGHSGEPWEVLAFSPYGYDERQYCSPGFNLPVGCLMRSVWGSFPEYHTSADNLDFIRPDALARSLRLCISIIDVLEGNRSFLNLQPYCEPQLGKRGLYRGTGGGSIDDEIHARLWVLNLSDGTHSLLEIAEQSGLPFSLIHDAAETLSASGLLEEVERDQP